ncbi:MAG: RNA methyltransferase [Burkholderiales bacterium]|jgi:TrmH family RNA methyltransferase|nr:RNA methyltransferase [Burkholderiales bacterium]
MITSKDNPQFKALKKLIHQPKRSDALMVVEGVHACQLLLKHQGMHHLRIEKVWVGRSALNDREVQSLLLQAQHQNIPVMELDGALFRELSSLEQGISVLFEVQRPAIEPMNFENITGNVVLLDGIQDPGNMGSILRTCAAAGVNEVWLNAQCVNPYSAKVIRAGVGAHFGIRIRENVDLNVAVQALKHNQITVCATTSHGTHNIYQQDLSQPIAWLMGNEGAGLSAELLAQADAALTIPMHLGESLNVASATAVCLFEMLRQQQR